MFLGLIMTPSVVPTKKSQPKMVELLVKARALVAAGWTQGVEHKMVNDKKHYCVIGALQEVTECNVYLGIMGKNKNTYLDLLHTFERANGIHGTDEFSGIPKWNDRWWRSKNSVLRAFDRAIQAA